MQSSILLLDMIQHKFLDVVLDKEVPDNTWLTWAITQSQSL